MSMPAGVSKKTKDNSRKKYREHQEWMEGKKLGRPHQQWVNGHWAKIMPPRKVED